MSHRSTNLKKGEFARHLVQPRPPPPRSLLSLIGYKIEACCPVPPPSTGDPKTKKEQLRRKDDPSRRRAREDGPVNALVDKTLADIVAADNGTRTTTGPNEQQSKRRKRKYGSSSQVPMTPLEFTVPPVHSNGDLQATDLPLLHKTSAPENSKSSQCQQQFSWSRSPKSRNVVHQLHLRESFGFKGRLSSSLQVNVDWKWSSWINFDTPNDFSTCQMAWDHQGVLLAVSMDTQIRIYDWDMVRSVDRQGRNLRAHNPQSTGTFVIDPILQFPCRSVTPTSDRGYVRAGQLASAKPSWLTWNPYHPDELAVGTPFGQVYVYDLGTELMNGVPFHRTYVDTSVSGNVSGRVSCLAFVQDGRKLLVSRDKTVTCFETPTSAIVWKWTWVDSGIATCTEVVPRTNYILLGSSLGYFALLDYSKYYRQNFSTLYAPTVLASWLPHQDLATPGGYHMGIRQLHIRHYDSRDITSEQSSNTKPALSLEVVWVTSCGWCMQTNLGIRSTSSRTATTILHATKPVQFKNSEGEIVPVRKGVATRSWSLPIGTAGMAAASSTSGMFVWVRVPELIRSLPHANKRVIDFDSNPRLDRDTSKSNRLMLLSQGGALKSIKLPKRIGKVLALAVHQEHDWIVVSSRNGLYVLSPQGIASRSNRTN